MNERQRIGLWMVIASVWFLVAAPHSEFTPQLFLVSLLLLWAGGLVFLLPARAEIYGDKLVTLDEPRNEGECLLNAESAKEGQP